MRSTSKSRFNRRDVSLPRTNLAIPAYYIIAPAEASSNLARFDGVRYGLRVTGEGLLGMYEATRSQGFGPEVTRRILLGTYVLSAGYYDAYYRKAQQVRTLIAETFVQRYHGVTALPPTTRPGGPIGASPRPVREVPSDISRADNRLGAACGADRTSRRRCLGGQLIAPNSASRLTRRYGLDARWATRIIDDDAC